ncbi:MAG: VOC family protein [Sphingomonadaceae bacterium]|nr:VOC family protein [Sphingomonadaceae bacterium]
MPTGRLEHANISVTNLDRSVHLLERLAGWHVRWRGPSMNDGETVHIGTDDAYVALYTHPDVKGGFSKGQPMNHIGIVVDDLEAAEKVVADAGLKAWGHDDYEPGRRFYFFDWDGIEWEIVSYD